MSRKGCTKTELPYDVLLTCPSVICHPTLAPAPSHGFLGRSPTTSVCAAIEQSLTPNGVYGLPVWKQDIRWSLLGFAFERNSGEEKEKEEGEMEETFTGRAGLPSYLDWMEVQLLVTITDVHSFKFCWRV